MQLFILTLSFASAFFLKTLRHSSNSHREDRGHTRFPSSVAAISNQTAGIQIATTMHLKLIDTNASHFAVQLFHSCFVDMNDQMCYVVGIREASERDQMESAQQVNVMTVADDTGRPTSGAGDSVRTGSDVLLPIEGNGSSASDVAISIICIVSG